MIGRILILAAAAIGGGVALGRKAVDRRIEDRLPAEIETAKELATAELKKGITEVISERLFAFAFSLCVKAALVAGVYLLFSAGHLTLTGLRWLVGFLIIVFIARDAVRTLPYFTPALRIVRRHDWNPRKALTEFIAGVAFERAYARAMIAMETGPNKMWLAMSKYSADSLSKEVAVAVADVARTTTFDNVKWRAFSAIVLALVMFAVYIAFFMLTVGASAAG